MSHSVKKLQVLLSLGQGFLHQLYNIKLLFNDPRVQPVFATQANSKVAKALIAKFPELPLLNEKAIPGFEVLTSRCGELVTQLEPHYQVFVDFIDWKDLVLKTMSEALNEVAELRMDINPLFTSAFMNLYVTLLQGVFFIIHNLEEKKLLIAGYSAAFSLKNSGAGKEESFTRITNFLKDYAAPLKKLWEDYKGFGPKVVQFLQNLFPSYIKSKTPTVLRKEGALSITLNPAKFSLLAHLPVHNEILNSTNASLWFVFGLLLSPEDLGANGVMDILKLIVAENFNVTLFRDETHFIYKDFESLFDYKTKTHKIDKSKKFYKEGTQDGQATGGAKHKDRRVYARQELTTLYHLVLDTPALLGPKFPLILAALAMAREETLWWFRHRDMGKVKVNPKDFEDNLITEVIYLITKFNILLRDHKDSIQQYYAEYLAGPDVGRLSDLIADSTFQKTIGTDAVSAIKSIIGAIQKATPKSDLSAVRDAWGAQEPSFASPVRSVPAPVICPVVDKVYSAIQHTRFLANYDEVVDEFASLRELFYFQNSLTQVFQKAIADGPNQPTHAMAYLIIASQFVENVTMFDPSEKERIGQDSVALAEKFLNVCMDRIISLVEQVASDYRNFDYQYADYLAIYSLMEKRPDFKPDRSYRSPVIPGSESLFAQRSTVENLRLYGRNIWQLCSALNEIGSITVYNSLFVPREFLIDRLKKLLKSVYARVMTLPPDQQPFKDEQNTPQTPSVVTKTLAVYFHAIKDLEGYVDIDVGRIIKDVMLTQAWAPSVGIAGGKLDWIESKSFEYLDNYIKTIAMWYSDFFNKRLSGPSASQLHICYSPNRKGFYTRRGLNLPFRAEMYLDLKELQHLVSIIGPYGVKIIDREILRFIFSNISTIRDTLKTFQKELGELVEHYQTESKAALILKSFRVPEVDTFIQRSIVIGSALQFRQLLREALGNVCETQIPILYNAVNQAFSQYPANLFMAGDLVPSDLLAQDAGINVNGADAGLKTMLIGVAQADVKLWDLLPPMFAASFVLSTYWRDASFNPSINGYENNVHVVSRTITDLLIAFKGLTSDVADEDEIAFLLRQFIEISAILLLRVISGISKEKTVPKDFASVVVFLDAFVEENKLLIRGDLEQVLPYALLRSMWRTTFSKLVKTKFGEEEDVF